MNAISIWSIGYGSEDFQALLERLQDVAPTHIVDVRSQPYSNYQVEFRRPQLDDLVKAAGMRYVYMGDSIGGKGAPEIGAEPTTNRPEFPLFRAGMDRLVIAAGQPNARIALLCGCLDPAKCHRSKLIGTEALERGIDLRHVMANGAIKLQSELEIGVQYELFGSATD